MDENDDSGASVHRKADYLTSNTGALPSDWDEEQQKAVAELVEDVQADSRLWGEVTPAQHGRPSGYSQADFLTAYPSLEVVPLSGDGYSCQFEAVGEAACGTKAIAGILRKRAVNLIREKWDEIGDLVLGEVAHQASIEAEALDLERCCELLLGSEERSPLWGNHATIAQLAEIVKKKIVVLTLSEGRPFKHIFDCEGASGTVHIGLIPEAHYFPVRPKVVQLKHGDKGLSLFSECS